MSDSPSVPVVLAIDCGTQSVRAAHIGARGEFLALGRVPLKIDAGGLAPSDLWKAVCGAVRSAGERAGQPSIGAVAITGQRASTIALDESGEPLSRILGWSQGAAASTTPALPWWLEIGARIVRSRGLLHALQQRAPVNRFRDENPDGWNATRMYHGVAGWVQYRMTGSHRDCRSAQVGYWPIDHSRGEWHGPRHWKWQALSLRPDQVPDLVDPGTAIGPLMSEPADELGLEPGIPVIACGADKGCEVLACHGHVAGTATISLGTAATISRRLPAFASVQRHRPAYYPAGAPGWDAEIQLDEGFRGVSEFVRSAAEEDPSVALDLTRLDSALHETGELTVGYLPFQRLNAAFPSTFMDGGWSGDTDTASIEDRYRALLTGTLLSLRFGLEHLERRFGKSERLVASGGGSRSDAVMQMLSDGFERAIDAPMQTESSLLGAAMTAHVGSGTYKDFESAIDAMASRTRTWLPQSPATSRLRAIYQRDIAPRLK